MSRGERPERASAVGWAWRLAPVVLGLAVGVLGCNPGPRRAATTAPAPRPPQTVRVATFNIQELSSEKVDSVDARGRGAHPQLTAAAEVVRRIRPDILVLNEVDLGRDGYGLDPDRLDAVVQRFRSLYLEAGRAPIHYPYVFVASSNTGILSGYDLNDDGIVATREHVGTREHGEDSWGFGTYPGQYSMAVLSRFPVLAEEARTFRLFRWKDLPGHHMPEDFYSEEEAERMRLSSKSHWDLPVLLDRDTLHFFVSHPTPPVFDGPEDRNGRRNYDEIGFWAAYLEDSPRLYDDEGRIGGFDRDRPFVIAGDLNASPVGGDAVVNDRAAIAQILDIPRVRAPFILDVVPTASFGGGTRVDYVLPSVELSVLDGGVFAPPGVAEDEEAALAEQASDHRLVWLDLRLPAR